MTLSLSQETSARSLVDLVRPTAWWLLQVDRAECAHGQTCSVRSQGYARERRAVRAVARTHVAAPHIQPTNLEALMEVTTMDENEKTLHTLQDMLDALMKDPTALGSD